MKVRVTVEVEAPDEATAIEHIADLDSLWSWCEVTDIHAGGAWVEEAFRRIES